MNSYSNKLKFHQGCKGRAQYLARKSFLSRVQSLDPTPQNDPMQKWPPTNYSFVFVLISLTSIVNTCKIERIWGVVKRG